MSHRESDESLWWLTVSPAVWLAHLFASYLTVALWCAKGSGRDGSLAGVRGALLAYTSVALVVVLAVAWRSLRRHRFGAAVVPHDFDRREARHGFLGFAAFLLSVLSAIGIVYDGLPVLFVETCR